MKTIKSFKELSKINRRDLYKGDKLKPLDKKFAISFARQLSEGFDADLNKPISKYKYQKAREVIETWYDATRSGKNQLIRPSKKNRKAYSEFAAMPDNFKVYLMPALEEGEKFIFNKRKKLVRKGRKITTENYDFPDRVKAMKNTEVETNKLLKRMEKDYKGRVKSVYIRVGRHETKTDYPRDSVANTIEKWTNAYGIEKTQKFVMGIRIFSFQGQQIDRPSRLKLKKKK